MKLKYFININLADKTARACQIRFNAVAFHNLLGDNFRLIAAGGTKASYIRHKFIANIKRESSKLRKLLFLAQSCIDIVSTEKNETIYSRNLFVLYCASLFRKKIVWEMHDAIDGTNLRLFEKLRNKLTVIVISNALKNYLIDKLNYDPTKIHVAHDAVFLDKYDDLRNVDKSTLRSDLGLPQDKTIVMHTGSLYKGRGAELFETIAGEYPDLLFVHVGGTPEDVARWKAYYEKYSNVCIFGHQANSVLVRYQMAADMLFLPMTKNNPIWWCTSPMKLFEFMATGRPILASNIGSVGEILNEQNAIIFEPENRESIIKGVHYFLIERSQAEQRGQKALNQVREHYTWHKRAESICNFLTQNGQKD